jgi:hypothetical protein
LNCTFAPLNAKLGGNREEARHVMGMLEPSVVVVSDADLASKLEDFAPEKMADVKIRLITPSPEKALPGWDDFQRLCRERDWEKRRFEGSGHRSETRRSRYDLCYQRDDCQPQGLSLYQQELLSHHARPPPARGFLNRPKITSSLLPRPISHIFGLNYSTGCHLAGLKVVHPSFTFHPTSTWEAIRLERCSEIPGVPALILALVAHPACKTTDRRCLKHVHMGSTTILPETIRICIEELGCEHASEAYGMAETGPAILHSLRELPLSAPEVVTAGRVHPEAKIRICKPDTREVFERGVPGECHVGGDVVVTEYWCGDGKRDSEGFYTDGEGTWIVTGDQAIMDLNGELRVVGRYKDLIIRGGENISPSAIESIVFSKFGLVVEVIGIPDDIAGEMPVAVVKSKEGVDLKKVREILVMELGPAWVPEEFIKMETLGIQDFPRTSTGKVLKIKLKEIVLEKRKEEEVLVSNENILALLTRVWTKLLGVGEGIIKPHTSVLDWADSLVLARFSAVLHREAGHLLALQELVEHHTLEAEAKLLASRGTSSTQPISNFIPKRDSPPTVDDMVHTYGDTMRAKQTEKMCNETLEPLGLGWKDVEDVIPMNGVQKMFLKSQRPQGNNHRHAWLCRNTSISGLQTALERALTHHGIFRTMALYFDSENPFHIMVRPSQTWFSHCITHLPAISSPELLSAAAYNDPNLDYACFPGPLFRAILVPIANSNDTGLIYQFQHSLFDAISFTLFLEDLDDLLLKPNTVLKPHVPYKAWADHYYNLSSSHLAAVSVNWQASRLKGISSHPKTLFPVQRAEGWFKGSSQGWIDISTSLPGGPRPSLDAHPIGITGIKGSTQLPDIQALKIEHGIETCQVVKAALAVMTTRHTGQSEALFGQSQAGRSWPFMLDWQVDGMPPSMDIDGPLLQRTLNRISISPSSTIINLLESLQNEQQLLNKHAYAPLNALVAALDKGIKGEGAFMGDAYQRQIFNWLPTLDGKQEDGRFGLENLKSVQVESRTDCGVLWNCVMLDRETVQIHPTWDDAQLGQVEVKGMLDEILGIATKLARKENWSKSLGEVVGNGGLGNGNS